MTLDSKTVRRIARLARIRLNEEEVPQLASELNSIFNWIEKLEEADTTGVEPMTSVVKMKMKSREDVVSEDAGPKEVLANAPQSEDGFYIVPKIVE
jgi:aspartyl-tRNA(Asn)/glutamyl-tRNA(Gln) amidotransferase subunit C